jgi:hypothetical protein
MKKIICLLFTVVTVHFSKAQVVLNFQLPPAGITLKNQLWNFTVLNSGPNNINVRMELVFSDPSSGQRIFTGTSAIYTLTQNVTQFQAGDLMPIGYNVLNSSYNIDVNPDGFLPIGQFEVCMAVFQINPETLDKIAEDCTTIEIEPISPPLLTEPANEELSYNKRPFFSWLPPAPANGFNNLSYDFSIVEVGSIQSPADAIQQNIPLFSQEGISTNSMLYPATLSELDTAKLYAWQVAARSSNNAIAKSEIFTFKVRDYNLDTTRLIAHDFYVPLKMVNDASFTSFGNQVKFEYLNELNDSSARISIQDVSEANNSVAADSASVHLSFGQNFITKDITGFSGLISKHIYLLELINSKQEHWYLKFEYRKPD